MTERRPPRHPKRLRWFVIGLVAVLVALEAFARIAEASGTEALRWYDASTQLRVEQMQNRGDVDVVFAGTSMAWQGFVPSVWNAHDREGRDAYNAGMAGGVPVVMEPWLVDEVLPRLRPDLVVWGLSSMDLSTAYGADNLQRYKEALAAREGVLARAEQVTARFSALVRYRNVLRDPSEWGADRGFEEARQELGADGERRDFTPDTSARRRRQVEARLAGYSLDPTDLAAIHRTVVRLREAGTEVVFVQMPVPDRYVRLHPGGTDDVLAARTAIDRLGEILDVQVIDATGGFTDTDFVDFTHLDEPSAAQLTEWVAAQVSGGATTEEPPTVDRSQLVEIANDLVTMADLVRSTLTQSGSGPDSSDLWVSPQEYGHTRDILAHHAEGTTFHTIFAGSSLVYAGFDPAVYAEESGLDAYNTGLPSVGPEEVAAFLEDVVLPLGDVERIVIGTSPRFFTAKGDGAFCGDDLSRYESAKEARSEVFSGVEWFEGVPLYNLLLGDPVTFDPARAVPMLGQYRGSYSFLGDRDRYPSPGPAKLEKEAEALRDQFADYEFCEDRLDALGRLVRVLTDRGIEVVVVAMPQSSYRVNPLPGGRDQMEQITADTETTVMAAGASRFLDFWNLLDDDQFYDLTHADRAASRQLTRSLVSDLLEQD